VREIKFRAWDRLEGKMVYDYKVKIRNDDRNVYPDISLNALIEMMSYHGDILMQYTGLKDKNGVEIYEGDIIKIQFDIDEVEDYIYLQLSEKERKEETAIRKVLDFPDCFSQPEFSADSIEVIGNIYENPVEEEQ